MALTNVVERKVWITCLLSADLKYLKDINCTHSILRWLIQRHIHSHVIYCHDVTVDDRSFVGIENTLLSTLALRDCKITDTGLLTIVDGCPHLESFCASSCHLISSTGIMDLSRGCNQLRDITFDGCKSLSDRWLSCVAKGCPNLTSFAISRSKYVTDTGISWIAGGCRKLERLTLEGCSKISDAGAIALASGCPDLKSISIKSCLRITDLGVSALSIKCHQLKLLSLHNSEISDDSLIAIANNSHELQCASFKFCYRITLSGLSVLATECRSLQRINLDKCRKVNDNVTLFSLRQNLEQAHRSEDDPFHLKHGASVISMLKHFVLWK